MVADEGSQKPQPQFCTAAAAPHMELVLSLAGRDSGVTARQSLKIPSDRRVEN